MQRSESLISSDEETLVASMDSPLMSTTGSEHERKGEPPREHHLSSSPADEFEPLSARNSLVADKRSWPFDGLSMIQHAQAQPIPNSQYPSTPTAIHPSYGIPPSPPKSGYTSISLEKQGAKHGLLPMSPPRSYNAPQTDTRSALVRRFDTPAGWLTAYFFFNLSLTLYNKYALLKFPFPWTLTAVHTLCGAFGAQICLWKDLFKPARLTTRENIIMLAFSFLYTINIAVSNISLHLVTVPFHQVVRAMTPLFTIAIGVIFLGKRPGTMTYLSLVPVVCGVVFATYGDYYFTRLGFFLTLLGTLLAALKTIATNLIQVGRLKLHPLDLLLRMSPLAFIQCVIFSWYSGEMERVRTYGALEMDAHKAWGLLLNGMIAFGLNVVSFTANKKTSALTMTVSANIKQVLTIILAVMMFNLHINFTNMCGISLTLFGGAWYAKVEMDNKKAQQNKPPALP